MYFIFPFLQVDEAFAGTSKAAADDMIEGIRKAFEDGLEDLEWLDEPTRTAAYEKAEAVRPKIGFPDFIQDDAKLGEYYEALPISPNGYFTNVLAGSAAATSRNLAELGKPVDREAWGMTASTVNAYYSPSMNEIVFPAAILQPTFFHADYPSAVRFSNCILWTTRLHFHKPCPSCGTGQLRRNWCSDWA